MAAVVSLAYADTSSAAIRTGSLSDGELFLDVVSAAGSATFDLAAPTVVSNAPGVAISLDPVVFDFEPGPMSKPGIWLQWDLFGTSAWASFVAAGSADATFDIKALGPSDDKSMVFLTTSSSKESDVRSQSVSQLMNFNQVGDFVTLTNAQLTHDALENGANFASLSMGNLYHQVAVGDKWKEFFIGTSTGAIGTELPFYRLSGDPADVGGNAEVAKYGGVWKLTESGVLSYQTTPVPEPGTLGLLAAGVILLRAITRRRAAVR